MGGNPRVLISPAWTMMEYGWYPLLLFLFTPFFMERLGAEMYGHWMLLIAVVGIGGVLNSGTGAALIKVVSSSIGTQSVERAGHAVNASLAIAMAVGGAVAIALACVFYLGASSIFHEMGDPSSVRLTGIAAAALLWIEQIDNVFSSALKGAERFARAAAIEMASKTLQVVLAAAVTILMPGLLSLYLALLIAAIVRLLAKAAATTRLIHVTRLHPTFADSSPILSFAKWGWLQGLGGALFSVVDRVLIGMLLGAASLAYYAVATQLAMQVHAATAAGLSVLFPIVSRKLAGKPGYSITGVVRLAMLGNVALCSFLAGCLWVFGSDFLELWLGPEQSQPVSEVLPYLVGAYWLLALNVTPHFMLLSMGRIRYVATSNIAAGCAFTLLLVIVGPRYGLEGIAAMRAIYGLIILVNFIPLLRRVQEPVHA